MRLNLRSLFILLMSACFQVPVFLVLIYFLTLEPNYLNMEVRLVGHSISDPFADYVAPLEEVDYEAYLRCRRLENSEIFRHNIPDNIKYFVVSKPEALIVQPQFRFLLKYSAWTIPESWPYVGNGKMKKEVYFWSWTIKSPYLDNITAHELGHIVGSTLDEIIAERIAAKIFIDAVIDSQYSSTPN